MLWTPIISSYGSGTAVEFLADEYDSLLAEHCDTTGIGMNSVSVGNVNIGKHCVIGANSVVTKDVPEYCVAVGSPTKVIKSIKN